MPYGYNGKILHVDLTSGTDRVEEPSWVFYRTYWGGGLLAPRVRRRGLIDPVQPPRAQAEPAAYAGQSGDNSQMTRRIGT